MFHGKQVRYNGSTGNIFPCSTSMDRRSLNNDQSFHVKTGQIGELAAAQYLRNRNHVVTDRNYTKPWGEIDVITRKSDCVHFVEVKTVSHETKAALEYAVTHETWRPEELVHRFKQNQIRKAAETWVLERQWEGDVQIDVAAVRIVPREKLAVVNFIENIHVE